MIQVYTVNHSEASSFYVHHSTELHSTQLLTLYSCSHHPEDGHISGRNMPAIAM